MSRTLQELDRCQTELGELILRVRKSPSLGGASVYEVKLDGAFLMSSAVNRSEVALAELGLEAFGEGPCEVLVGGLGLGHTAEAALRQEWVRHVDVLEYLEPVIGWHRDGLVPAAAALTGDPRCTLVHEDFFEHVADASRWRRRYDVILVDIDHSPESLLSEAHGRFYTAERMEQLARDLGPGGVFGVWSAEPPGEVFMDRLAGAFGEVEQHTIAYQHPMLREEERNTVVLARCGGSPPA